MKPLYKNFIPISVDVIRRLKSPLFFDLYVQRTDTKFSRLFAHGDMLDYERTKKYAHKGVMSFFVKEEEYAKYNAFLGRVGQKLLGPNELPLVEKINIVRDLVHATMYDIMYHTSLSESTLNNATTTVSLCINQLAENPRSMARLLKAMSGQPGLFKHSMSTSIFALLLARAEKIQSPNNLNIIGLGAFFHDIGHSTLSFDTETQEHLSREQWKEMKTHPQAGKAILDNNKKLRGEVTRIVLEHHEQVNGMGYPNGLKKLEIFRPALMVSIADAFSSLLAKKPYREALPPKEAIDIMLSDQGKFDPDLLQKFIAILNL